MVQPMTDDEFDACIDDALEQIPQDLLDAVENCIITVEDESEAGDDSLLGLYVGIPLTARDSSYAGVLPDRIELYKGPLERMCLTRAQLVEEIKITVWHEIAHHFGIDDAHLHELGY